MAAGLRKISLSSGEHQIHPMTGDRLLRWSELQILCALEKIQAHRIADEGDTDKLPDVLSMILFAQVAMVAESLAISHDQARELTILDHAKVVDAQNEANGIGEILDRIARPIFCKALSPAGNGKSSSGNEK